MTPTADSAGVPFEGRTFHENPGAGDDGSAPPRLLETLSRFRAREVGAAEDRRAWFVSALTLGWPDGHTDSFFGRVAGCLAWPPRGTNGFGYDPMFVPTGETRTFGELRHAEKEAISHRARAFAQFAAACLGATQSGRR